MPWWIWLVLVLFMLTMLVGGGVILAGTALVLGLWPRRPAPVTA